MLPAGNETILLANDNYSDVDDDISENDEYYPNMGHVIGGIKVEANLISQSLISETNICIPPQNSNESQGDVALAGGDGEVDVGGATKDYLNLARMYKIERAYSDPNADPDCVLCHRGIYID